MVLPQRLNRNLPPSVRAALEEAVAHEAETVRQRRARLTLHPSRGAAATDASRWLRDSRVDLAKALTQVRDLINQERPCAPFLHSNDNRGLTALFVVRHELETWVRIFDENERVTENSPRRTGKPASLVVAAAVDAYHDGYSPAAIADFLLGLQPPRRRTAAYRQRLVNSIKQGHKRRMKQGSALG